MSYFCIRREISCKESKLPEARGIVFSSVLAQEHICWAQEQQRHHMLRHTLGDANRTSSARAACSSATESSASSLADPRGSPERRSVSSTSSNQPRSGANPLNRSGRSPPFYPRGRGSCSGRFFRGRGRGRSYYPIIPPTEVLQDTSARGEGLSPKALIPGGRR